MKKSDFPDCMFFSRKTSFFCVEKKAGVPYNKSNIGGGERSSVKNFGKVFCYREADAITVYWNKPYTASAGLSYLVRDDAGHVAEVVKTHARLENLLPEHSYRIDVHVYGDNGKGKTLIGVFTPHTVKTCRRKEDIYVTAEEFGIVGDGKTLNTDRIQKVIDSCRPDQRIVFPEGIYLTGALRLHSDMELHLQKGAVLRGTDEVKDYEPKIKSRFEGIEMDCYSSLINIGELDHSAACRCKNVILAGEGTIESGGKILAERVMERERQRLRADLERRREEVLACENENTIPGRARPRLIQISNAKNIRISGLTLKNGASWNVQMIYSDQVLTDHCTFFSEGVWNGDGWDPDSSTNCMIFACEFYTGDDAISIKSGKNPQGNRINRPAKHIRIFDCKSMSGHGITIGSEMSGGVRDVSVWDCDMEKSLYGVEIKATPKRGGYVKNIRVRDCIVPRVLIHSVSYNDDGIPAESAPLFSDFIFSNLEITGKCTEKDGTIHACKAVELIGFEEEGHEIRDVHFRGGKIRGGIRIEKCSGVTFRNME